ncbi:MAG: hypothetical protein P9L91_10685 [Candidatus Zophobacter franzmannii]|jgi:flagellar hook assembly protein FlgD|nr:hypothetical protein [Candidatus Zophobacter franzmannii]
MSLSKKILVLVLIAIAASMFAISVSNEGVNIYVQPEEYKTTATMIVDFSETSLVTIDMYDDNDNLVDSFFRGEAEKGEMVFVLDRYALDGSFLSEGKYEIRVASLGRYISKKKTVILK